MTENTSSPLIVTHCWPGNEVNDEDLKSTLSSMGYIDWEEDLSGMYLVVAKIMGEDLVAAWGYKDPQAKLFSLEFILPLKEAIPNFDFAGQLVKHFPEYMVRYSPPHTLEEQYVNFITMMGMSLRSYTFVSGEEECPPPAETNQAKRFEDVPYLDKERLRTLLKFQSQFPENDPRSVAYFESIDTMFEESETYPDIAAVGYRDGKPVGLAVIEKITDSHSYRLSFSAVMPDAGEGVLEEMLHVLTFNIERYGCVIGVNLSPDNQKAIERIGLMGYCGYTIDFERR